MDAKQLEGVPLFAGLSRKERDLLREFASLSDATPRAHLGVE